MPSDRRDGRLPSAAEELLQLDLPEGSWLEIEVQSFPAGLEAGLEHEAQSLFSVAVETAGKAEILVHFCRQGGHHLVRLRSPSTSAATYSYQLGSRLLPQPAAADRWREEALRLSQQARQDLRENQDPARLETASNFSWRAAALWSRLNQVTRVAETHETAAHALFRGGELRLAANHFAEAIASRKLSGDIRWEVSDHNFLGLALRQLQDRAGARREFTLAEKLAADDGFLPGQAAALNNLGLIEQDEGNFGQARVLYQRALRVLAPLTSAAVAQDAALYRENLARLLILDGDLEEAERLLQPAPGASRNHLTASAQAELAWLLLLKDKPRQALETLDDALPRCRDAITEIIIHDRRGTALERLGLIAEAAAAYQKSLDLARGRAPVSTTAATLASLCRLKVLHPGEKTPGTESACRQAIEVGRQAGVPPATVASGLFWQVQYLRGKGKIGEAQAVAHQAARMVSELRMAASSADRQSLFLENRADYLHLAIELAMELHSSDRSRGFDRVALADSELWRAKTLTDHLDDLERGDPASADLQVARRRLQDHRTMREIHRFDGFPTETLDAEIEQLEQEVVARDEALRASRPRLEELRTAALDLAAVQSLLDRETQIFDLVLGEPSSFLWRISRSQIESFVLPARPVLEKQATLYLELIASPRLVSHRAAAVKLGTDLAEALFGKHLARLGAPSGRLVFIGDGALTPFPIAALPTPATTPDQPVFLVEDFEIVQLPSLRMLLALRRPGAAKPGPTRTLALIGDPWYDLGRSDDGIGLKAISTPEARALLGVEPAFPLGRLPFAALEMDLIASHFRGRPWSILRAEGPAATRKLALSDLLDPYAIIHFSAHGDLGPRAPEPSAIVLSDLDDGGRPVNGRLRPDDLADLGWRAELVVASACQSANGRSFRFEGIAGLARGFFFAGANRTLASLWQVQGAATAALMNHFYAALIDRRLPPAAALRAAQQALLADARAEGTPWRAPYYWSGFVLIGDWQAFSLPGNGGPGTEHLPPESV